MTPTRGLLRALRAASLGAVGFTLALVAHLAAGGAAPGSALLLPLAGLIALAAVLLTGAQLSLVRVGISLSAMQVFLHQALMWLDSQAGCQMAGVSAAGGMPMSHGSQPMNACAAAAHSVAGQGSMLASTTMLGAHVAATAVMVGLLGYGEKVLWFLAGCVRPARWLRVSPPEPPAARTATCGAPRMVGAQFACGGVGRRGPPHRLFAAL